MSFTIIVVGGESLSDDTPPLQSPQWAIFRSFDAGAQWSQALLPHSQSQDDASIHATWVGDTLFLATAADDAVWISENRGDFRLQKLPGGSNECDHVGAIFVYNQKIFVDYQGGEQTIHPNCAFVSDALGLQWHVSNFQTKGQPLVAIAASPDQRYVLAQDKNSRNWLSVDGTHWTPFPTIFPDLPQDLAPIQKWSNIAPDGTVVAIILGAGLTMYECDATSKTWRDEGFDSQGFTVSYASSGHPTAIWGHDSLGRLVMFPLN